MQNVNKKDYGTGGTIKNSSLGALSKFEGYGEKDNFDFKTTKMTKEDKQQKRLDHKIGDLLNNFKRMREEKFGKKEEDEPPKHSMLIKTIKSGINKDSPMSIISSNDSKPISIQSTPQSTPMKLAD